ncbi:MAG TPA: polymer-forming cytoskeletal protein [Rhizomicrobium sp.]|nr:polymer-forming cytoskeletal protein [Rhizomicrobium sp.]
MPDSQATQSPLSSEARRPQAVSMPAASTSVISKALKITGQLESSEHIQVDGQIEGDVRGLTVKVGPGAKVKGTVSGDEVELSGAIEGKIDAKKVILTGSARMTGDIMHQDIRIESGAYVDGHLRPESAGAKTPQLKPVTLEKTA